MKGMVKIMRQKKNRTGFQLMLNLTALGLLAMVITIIGGSFGQEAAAQYPDPVRLGGIAEVTPESRLIRFKEDTNIPAATLFTDYHTAFGLGPFDRMELMGIGTKDDTMAVYQFVQLHGGIPVHGAFYSVVEISGRCAMGIGFIMPDLEVGTNAVLTEEEALVIALDTVDAQTYMWESSDAEATLSEEAEDSLATYYPTGVLTITSPFSETYDPLAFELAYCFNVYAAEPEGHEMIYIDAVDGTVIRRESKMADSPVDGRGPTIYDGDRSFIVDKSTDKDGNDQYELLDETRNKHIRVKDHKHGNLLNSPKKIYDDTNDPFDTDDVANNAYYALKLIYDYFADVHDWYGWNGKGTSKTKCWVHVGDGTEDFRARFDAIRIRCTDGDFNSDPQVTLDLLSHETMHAISEKTALLLFMFEPGALQEGLGDIFGYTIERAWRPLGTPADWWTMAEQTQSPSDILPGPRTYKDDQWIYDLWDDLGGVHANGEVLIYWFKLLTEGGSGINYNGDSYSVSSIGVDKAAAVAFNTLANADWTWVFFPVPILPGSMPWVIEKQGFLYPFSGFKDMRDATLLQAELMYGTCSFEYNQIIRAWNAVGLISPLTLTGNVYGPATFCANTVINLGPMYVEPTGDLTVRSPIQVNLKPGFKAEKGSTVQIEIACCR